MKMEQIFEREFLGKDLSEIEDYDHDQISLLITLMTFMIMRCGGRTRTSSARKAYQTMRKAEARHDVPADITLLDKRQLGHVLIAFGKALDVLLTDLEIRGYLHASGEHEHFSKDLESMLEKAVMSGKFMATV